MKMPNEKLKEFSAKELFEAAIEKSKDIAMVVEGQRIFKGSFVGILGTMAILKDEILGAFRAEQLKVQADKKLVVPVPTMPGDLKRM